MSSKFLNYWNNDGLFISSWIAAITACIALVSFQYLITNKSTWLYEAFNQSFIMTFIVAVLVPLIASLRLLTGVVKNKVKWLKQGHFILTSFFMIMAVFNIIRVIFYGFAGTGWLLFILLAVLTCYYYLKYERKDRALGK